MQDPVTHYSRCFSQDFSLKTDKSARRGGRVLSFECCRTIELPVAPASAYCLGKRSFDLLVGLALLGPVLLLSTMVALLILISDKATPIFWQKRVGKGGRVFWFPKFRTMIVGAEHLMPQIRHYNQHSNSITFKMEDDFRVTGLGRHLRRWSLDELPQFLCVLRGDMSLVGPRPALVDEVEKYGPAEMQRLMVKPGLTCLWQVGGRSDLPFSQQLALDLKYIETKSLWLDFLIVLKTIPAVLSRRGAY